MITANEAYKLGQSDFTRLEVIYQRIITNAMNGCTSITVCDKLTQLEKSELEAQGFLIWCTDYTYYIVWGRE